MTAVLSFLAHRKKALTGFFAPGVALLVTDYTTNGGDLPTEHQWAAIGAACVLTAFGVHQVANKPKKG